MKNTVKSSHITSLIVCIMGLTTVNYSKLSTLDIIVLITILTAIMSIVANIISTNKRSN